MNIFKKFVEKRNTKELHTYIQQVHGGDSETLGAILAHSLLIYSQLLRIKPFLNEIAERDKKAENEAALMIVETNRLLNEYSKDTDEFNRLNAAGIKLLNMTFRCIAHPDLSQYSDDIWSYFKKAQTNADNYLLEMKNKFVIEENEKMVQKIDEAEQAKETFYDLLKG